MATEQGSSSGSGNGFLYFAIGALIVAVGVLGWMFYNGQTSRTPGDTAIEQAAESIGDAADRIGDSAKDAAGAIPQPAPAPAPQPAPPPAPPG